MQRWTREYSWAMSQRRQPGCNQSGRVLCIIMGVQSVLGGVGGGDWLSNCSGVTTRD